MPFSISVMTYCLLCAVKIVSRLYKVCIRIDLRASTSLAIHVMIRSEQNFSNSKFGSRHDTPEVCARMLLVQPSAVMRVLVPTASSAAPEQTELQEISATSAMLALWLQLSSSQFFDGLRHHLCLEEILH